MRVLSTLFHAVCGLLAFPHYCNSAVYTTRKEGGIRFLRNPGKKVKRLHEIIRGDILEQTHVKSEYEKVCANSALQTGQADEEVQFSDLEMLTPYEDIPRNWLNFLRRDSSVQRESETQLDTSSGLRRQESSPSALEMGKADDTVQFSDLESLTPYSDIPENWLRFLRRDSLVDLRRETELESSSGQRGRETVEPANLYLALTHQAQPQSNLARSAKPSKPVQAIPAQPAQPAQPSLSAHEEANAKQKLTTWRCVQAHGSNYGQGRLRMTCKFKNLYYEGRGEGQFVAHTLANDAVKVLPTMSFGVGEGQMDLFFNIHLVRHKSLFDFANTFLNSTRLEHMPGLSLAFAPLYHFNVGHGLFDGLYPAFVSLMQHGAQFRPFRPLLVGGRNPEVNVKCPHCYKHVEDIFGMIGGLNTTTTIELRRKSGMYHLEETIIGIGTNSAKVDMNVNLTLGGCRALDACRAFRKRAYDFANVSLRPRVREERPFRAGIVTNKRFGVESWHFLQQWLQNQSQNMSAKELQEFQFDPVTWTPEEQQQGAGILPDSVQLGDFRAHLQILSDTDVLISSPGTAMMYQTFLPDGAVLINMGDAEHSYMEEYMAEGSPYLRALYYPLRKFGGPGERALFDRDTMRNLLLQARHLLQLGFTDSTPVNRNLSPLGRFFKAFSYWKHGQVVSQEMLATYVPPTRAFRDFDMLGDIFVGPQAFARWSCHHNGTFAGVLHTLARAFHEANPQQRDYFEDLLIKPLHQLQYESNLSEYVQLSGLGEASPYL